jgi:hypothetical protein
MKKTAGISLVLLTVFAVGARAQVSGPTGNLIFGRGVGK